MPDHCRCINIYILSGSIGLGHELASNKGDIKMIRKGDELTPFIIKVGIVLILVLVLYTALNPPGNPFDVIRYIEEVEQTGNCYNELRDGLNDTEMNAARQELIRVGIHC